MTAGLIHTCALTTTNHVYCWGWNRDGEIGDGSKADRPYAMQVSNTLTFSGVSAGGAHSCAVASQLQAPRSAHFGVRAQSTPVPTAHSPVLASRLQVPAVRHSADPRQSSALRGAQRSRFRRLGGHPTSRSSVPVAADALRGAACGGSDGDVTIPRTFQG